MHPFNLKLESRLEIRELALPSHETLQHLRNRKLEARLSCSSLEVTHVQKQRPSSAPTMPSGYGLISTLQSSKT
jgi:hypothetical protein